jgi:hypothetical protein
MVFINKSVHLTPFILIFLTFWCSITCSYAQIEAAGDIAITSLNTDGTDGLSFVLLKDALEGTTITFDERDNDGSGNMTGSGGQITLVFSAPVGAGTVISFDNSPTFVNGFSSATLSLTGSFSLSGSDEFVHAYLGNPSTSPSTFLAAAASDNYAGSGTNSLGGTGLTSGVHAWEYDVFGSPDEDIIAYVGGISGASVFSHYLDTINNQAGNWSSQDAAGDQSSDGVSPEFCNSGGSCGGYTLPMNFTVSTPCTSPTSQPTSIVLNAGATVVHGSYTSSVSSPSGYLIVRYPTGASPANPVNGNYYATGAALGSGEVITMTTDTFFENNGMSPNTGYDFYVYAYNSLCSGQPNYNVTTPLSGTTTTSSSVTNVVNNTGAFGPSDSDSRDSATVLNDSWESVQQGKDLTCSSGWTTVYGDLSFNTTTDTGTITNLVITDISTTGTGISYPGTATFVYKNIELDPDNSLTAPIIDRGPINISSNPILTNSDNLQDGAPSPNGVGEYFSTSTGGSHRSSIEINFSVPVSTVGFFLGDVEGTTSNNGSDPFTPAIVVVYDSSGNEFERKVITTATAGGNCVSNSTSQSGSGGTCAIGCGSAETVWVDIQSPSTNISRILVVVGDYVDQNVTSGCPGTGNSGSDRGTNEHGSFGGLTLGGNCTVPLPVTFISFTANNVNSNLALLEWCTASEENNSHFEVFKYVEDLGFTFLGQVQGAGNSSSKECYSFSDPSFNPFSKEIYRLKQVDFDGKSTWGPIAFIAPVQSNLSQIQVCPNPSNGEISIKGELDHVQQIELFTSHGKRVSSFSPSAKSLSLNPGIYFLVFHGHHGLSTSRKIIVLED